MTQLTKESLEHLLKQGMSRHGAWSKAQFHILLPNEHLPNGCPVKGWKDRLIGTTLSNEQSEHFVQLKDQHLPNETLNLFFR